MLKKIIAASLCAAMLCAQTASCASAAGDYSWAETEIEYCRQNGIMTGDENGDLDPGGTLTRAQMAKMLIESFGADDAADAGGQQFSDISPDQWY